MSGRTGAIALRRVEEDLVRLDRHEARDDADERGRPAARPSSRRSSPRERRGRDQRREVEAERDDDDLIVAADAAGEDVAPHPRRHRDERARTEREAGARWRRRSAS